MINGHIKKDDNFPAKMNMRDSCDSSPIDSNQDNRRIRKQNSRQKFRGKARLPDRAFQGASTELLLLVRAKSTPV